MGEHHEVYAEKDRYVYLGELAISGYAVIGVAPLSVDDLVRMLLLNEQTGDTTEISGVPVASPNRKRLLVIPYVFGPESSVEIWSLATGAPRYEFGFGDDETRPIDGEWKDDSTVIYRAVPLHPGPKADTVRMQFPFRDGAWQSATTVAP
ncbi:MAG: hypothetical protein ACJ79K_05915 [Gemmatimonadaceae bacterium]